MSDINKKVTPPVIEIGVLGWMRKNLFSTWYNTVLTLIGLYFIYIIIPQALRVIVPPLTNQYLNLTKNSSLAAAIAYPDLVLVFAGTALMQTGQAIEIIGMVMGVYLFLSLFTSIIMNLFNRIMRVGER